MSEEENKKTIKRQNFISWDDYFMAVAFLSAQRSKDPSTQVGACIVNTEKKIVGIGLPWGCSDDEFPWERKGSSPLDTKYPFVCHAGLLSLQELTRELNAIMNKNSGDLKGCKLYVAMFPCNECSKLIIQSGIKEILYYGDKYHNEWQFDAAGVRYTQHIPSQKQIVINFESVNEPSN